MERRIIVNQIDYVLSNVFLVTVNSKLKKFISDSIKYNKGKLRNCPTFSDECNFLFKNDRGEHVYINIVNDKVYVYVNRLNGIEEVSYCKDSDGVSVVYNSSISSCIFGNLQTINTKSENTKYDLDGNLIVHRTDINESTYINGKVFDELMYTNYDRTISDFIVSGELVRFDDYRYQFHPELNRKICYVSEYSKGMFLSGDDVNVIRPRFMPFSGDSSNYSDKLEIINKKCAQNVKSMI